MHDNVALVCHASFLTSHALVSSQRGSTLNFIKNNMAGKFLTYGYLHYFRALEKKLSAVGVRGVDPVFSRCMQFKAGMNNKLKWRCRFKKVQKWSGANFANFWPAAGILLVDDLILGSLHPTLSHRRAAQARWCLCWSISSVLVTVPRVDLQRCWLWVEGFLWHPFLSGWQLTKRMVWAYSQVSHVIGPSDVFLHWFSAWSFFFLVETTQTVFSTPKVRPKSHCLVFCLSARGVEGGGPVPERVASSANPMALVMSLSRVYLAGHQVLDCRQDGLPV